MSVLSDEKYLINEAYKAMEYAYSPYSEFKVGAALVALDEEGNEKLFSGCNIENISYGATICAERTAMCKAVSEGYKKLKCIAIVSSQGEFTYPCGMCRQFLSEFSDDKSVVFLHNKANDEILSKRFKELLPDSFEF